MMHTLTRAAAAGVALLALAGCSSGGAQEAAAESSESPSAEPTTFDASGSLTLVGQGGSGAEGKTCQGYDGYDDMGLGAQVTVFGADGTAVAVGYLEAGYMARQPYPVDNDCVFEFLVEEVPLDAGPIYAVEVTSRGQVRFTLDEADDLALTLG